MSVRQAETLVKAYKAPSKKHISKKDPNIKVLEHNLMEKIGMNTISSHEKKLTDYALKVLPEIEGIQIFGSPNNRNGVISFNLDGIHAHDLAQFLNEDNIAIRVGHHCAQPLISSLNQNSVARLSLYIYNNQSDIDIFCDSVRKIKRYF